MTKVILSNGNLDGFDPLWIGPRHEAFSSFAAYPVYPARVGDTTERSIQFQQVIQRSKNCFTGLVVRDCSLATAISSRATPEPAKLPNEEWIIEIATAIAATIMDKRIKTIFRT